MSDFKTDASFEEIDKNGKNVTKNSFNFFFFETQNRCLKIKYVTK